jgi:hypothetical protein
MPIVSPGFRVTNFCCFVFLAEGLTKNTVCPVVKKGPANHLLGLRCLLDVAVLSPLTTQQVLGELGARDSVTPPFALLFIQVFLPTQMTTLFMPTTFQGLSRR